MKRIDYRHIICIVITLGCLACGVMFVGALGRIIEGGRDIITSIAYYFSEVYGVSHNIAPTVNNLPQTFDWLPAPDIAISFPSSLEAFQADWVIYWNLWVNWDNFVGYLNSFGDIMYVVSMLFMPVLLLVVLLRMAVSNYLKKQVNGNVVESKQLQAFKRFSDRTYKPTKEWLLGFITFIKEHRYYWVTWFCLWAFYFNFFTIFLEFFAFFFYFTASFSIADIYMQFYKLLIDLMPVIRFVPLWAWICLAIWGLSALARHRAYKKLTARERRNRAFLKERGIINTVVGYVGAGKTTLLTDMALSYEVQMLDDALEIILETDMHFPNFPWANLERVLRFAFQRHYMWDKWSVINYVRKKRLRWEQDKCRKKIFDYDYERYGVTYDNKLCLINIWEAIEDYAQAYLIYTVQSSYIISNYSIRSDKLIDDLGNFPLWNTDFFKRDSRLIDSFSRHSHILDFDMLRLGKKMLKDNPNRNAFGFGVYVVSEIDKERKNSPELQEVKKNVDECNQKNDLTNVLLKMSRHPCFIANRVFVYMIFDLQRTGSLNSDMLELGDTIEVRDKGEMSPVLPFYSPFWFVDLFSSLVFGKFNDFYSSYKYMRTDNTLFAYLLKGVVARIAHYRERTYNLFGSQDLKLRYERGLKDGETNDYTWYRQSKKVYSKRFASNCIIAPFEVRGALNTIGLDDMREYATIMASNDERLMQHSYFQKDMDKYSELTT